MKEDKKQTLCVTDTYLVWNGISWVTMYDILIQPNGERVHAVESTHMTGSRQDWRFIGKEERDNLIYITKQKIN